MISAYSIILEDKILYCSDEKKYNAFEIVLFVEKLLRSINPRNTWRLKKICLKNKKIGRERIIVEHAVTKAGQNLFFCSVGNFNVGSLEAFKMLEDFNKQVNIQYNNLDRLIFDSEEPTFKQVINLIIDYLKDKYLEPLEEEIIYEKINNNGDNALLYAGISAQGLPIISQLYDKTLLRNLAREKTNENIELFSSDLSAKLATISMNTQIRAKTKIKEIHIQDTEKNAGKKIIFFGNINGYSLDFIATGNFYKIKDIFKKLKAKMSLDSAFQDDFSGDLRPFKHLILYLNNVIKDFDLIN
ncbi:MAG: hypothetical protein JSV23_00105 [Promethearchaeota archaeon]|nr:MAG: hypothetical protein JSV23_00105 [Candidatus Lokiarchaeota archaeon]